MTEIRMVVVEWHDATSNYNMKPSLTIVYSVGLVVDENEESLSLAQSWYAEGFKAFITVPKPIIKKVTELGTLKITEAKE